LSGNDKDCQVRLSEIKLDLSKIEQDKLKDASRVHELQLHLDDQRIRKREELDNNMMVHKMRYDTKNKKLHLAALTMFRNEEKERDTFNNKKKEEPIIPKDSLAHICMVTFVIVFVGATVCGTVALAKHL